MTGYNLCLIGFGNVGQAFVRLLEAKTAELRDRYGIEWRLTGLMTRRLGFRADPAGFDPFFVLDGAIVPPALPVSTSVRRWLELARADVLFEVSSLDVRAGEPAITYLRTALEAGAHAITANKGPVAYGYRKLRDLALARGKAFRFESTVMDGVPIFSLFRQALPAIDVYRFRGILNSTSNIILEEMEQGRSFDEAVRRAQELGIAESDPGADLDGWDAAVKVAALVQVVMDEPIGLAEITREGIRHLDGETVRAARVAGTPYKLVCQAERHGPGVVARVGPERVGADDPLARVRGTSSLIHFETDVLPGLTITEHNPCPTTTAYGLLADFIAAVRERGQGF